MLLLISSYREVAVQPRSRLCAWVCVYVRVHPVSVIGRGCENAGRSICSGWCQQTVPVNSDSISAGICGNWREGGVRREEGQQEQEGTLEGLFLWVTVLLVLSPLVPLIENQTEKKNLSLFTPGLSNFSFLLHLPLFHSGFYRTPSPFSLLLALLWGCHGN